MSIIEIKNLSKYYGDFLALDNLSMSVKKGEVLGLLGPNGAGKTTTIRILTGYLSPSSGSLSVKGLDVEEHRVEVKKKIGYLPESAPVYSDMMVFDYLQFVAGMHDLSSADADKRIRQLSEMCDLKEVLTKHVSELSKGYRQRVGLAHALMSDPEILVLDEPTIGLDPNQIVGIRELLREIGKEKTVMLSSHILSEIEATCDRLVIINRGKIVAEGHPEEIRKKLGKQMVYKLAVEGTDGKTAAKAFSDMTGVSGVDILEDEGSKTRLYIKADEKTVSPSDVYNQVKQNNWNLTELTPQAKSLEELFKEITQGESNG